METKAHFCRFNAHLFWVDMVLGGSSCTWKPMLSIKEGRPRHPIPMLWICSDGPNWVCPSVPSGHAGMQPTGREAVPTVGEATLPKLSKLTIATSVTVIPLMQTI